MNNFAQARWPEARERMRPCIDAVFSQEAGISLSARQDYVDWILDVVVKAEYVAAIANKWTVWCRDGLGNQFTLQKDVSHDEAVALVARLQGRDRRQSCWLGPAVSQP